MRANFAVAVVSLGALMGTAQAADFSETCGLMVTRNGKLDDLIMPGFSLTALAANADLPPLAAPEGAKIEAVWCRRKELVLLRNDYKPLLQGYIFYLGTEDGRMGVLEYTKAGGYRFRVVKGELTPAEKEKGKNYLNQ